MKAILRHEIDISLSVFKFDFNSFLRTSPVSVYHHSWRLQYYFFFLETQSLKLSSSKTNQFIMPFSAASWRLIMILLLLVTF